MPRDLTAPAPRAPTPDEIIADPCASYWLKSAARDLLRRDCVDAACDAATLSAAFQARAARLLQQLEP